MGPSSSLALPSSRKNAPKQRAAEAQAGALDDAPGPGRGGGQRGAGDRQGHAAGLERGDRLAAADRDRNRQHRRQRGERRNRRHLADRQPAIQAGEAEQLRQPGARAERHHCESRRVGIGQRPGGRRQREAAGLGAEQHDDYGQPPRRQPAQEVRRTPGDAGAQRQCQRDHRCLSARTVIELDSMAASRPHGADVRAVVGAWTANFIGGPPGRRVGDTPRTSQALRKIRLERQLSSRVNARVSPGTQTLR
jgi:hypothetical protein